jgi:hypothetical protein
LRLRQVPLTSQRMLSMKPSMVTAIIARIGTAILARV